jgi:hypothetical protein
MKKDYSAKIEQLAESAIWKKSLQAEHQHLCFPQSS